MTTMDVNTQNASGSTPALANSSSAPPMQTNAPASTWLGRSWAGSVCSKIYSQLSLDRIAQAGIAGSVILGAATNYAASETDKLEGPIVATLGAALSCMAWGIGSTLQGKNEKALKCFAAATALTGISHLTSQAGNSLLATLNKSEEQCRSAEAYDQHDARYVMKSQAEEIQRLIGKLDAKDAEIESLRHLRLKSWDDCAAKIEERRLPLLTIIKEHNQNTEPLRKNLAKTQEELAQCTKTALYWHKHSRAQLVAAAIGKRDVASVKKLIEEAISVNHNYLDSYTGDVSFLYLAVIEGDEEIVNLLIQAGAELNVQKWNGETPLFAAIEHNKLNIVKALIQAKADVNFKSDGGNTPLMKVSQCSWLDEKDRHEILNALIEAKADLNMKNKRGLTALSMATLANNIKHVEMLLQAKADPTIKDSSGNTALDYALRKHDNPKLAALFSRHMAA